MKLPRLYPILDTSILQRTSCRLPDATEALLDAGVRILQIRHKDHFSRAVLGEIDQVSRLAKSAGALLLINDRADIAALMGAGLHVGQDDLPPEDARRLIGAGPILGYSTHNAAQLTDADCEPVDYLAIGPVFATTTKAAADPVLGLQQLAALRGLTSKPLVAIGGIQLESVESVFRAGADSVAVISGLLPSDGTAAGMREQARRWLEVTGAYVDDYR